MNFFVISEVVSASQNGSKFFKAEGIDILKKFVMEKLLKKDEVAASDKKIPTYLYKVNQSIVL